MGIIFDDEIFVTIIKERVGFALYDESWIRMRFARKLELDLLEVIAVDVTVTPRPDEITNL
jgi:hypothetical protein